MAIAPTMEPSDTGKWWERTAMAKGGSPAAGCMGAMVSPMRP